MFSVGDQEQMPDVPNLIRPWRQFQQSFGKFSEMEFELWVVQLGW